MAQQGGGPFDRILGGSGAPQPPPRRPKEPPAGRKRPDAPPTPPRRPAPPLPRHPRPATARRDRSIDVAAWAGGENTPYVVGGAIIFFALLLWLLFLPPFSIVSGGGEKGFDLGGGIRAVPQRRLPDVP